MYRFFFILFFVLRGYEGSSRVRDGGEVRATSCVGNPEKLYLLGRSSNETKVDILLGNRSRNGVFEDTRNETVDLRTTSWLNEFANLPILFASSPNIPEGRCKDQVRRYLDHLDNATLWAVQMYDASTKYPDGIIYGHRIHLGNFDQCYNLRARLPSDESNGHDQDEIYGRYCLIRLSYRRKGVAPTPRERMSLDFDPNLSVWDAIDDIGDFRRVKRDSMYVALCVPATCTPSDVQSAIAEPISKFGDEYGVSIETKVKDSLSQTRWNTPNRFGTGPKIFCGIVALLVVLVVGCSWYDDAFYSREEAKRDANSGELALLFSARRNIREIFNKERFHPGLDSIHLIRFIVTTYIVAAHRVIQFSEVPVTNAVTFEPYLSNRAYMPFLNGQNNNDYLFSIGGLLLAFTLLEQFDRNKKMNFSAILFIRYLRMAPLYMLIVFFNASVLGQLGSGPLWKTYVGENAEYCTKYWWTNLLNINNYVNPDKMCMFQTWYLSVDFQLYLIGSLVLWVFWNLPKKMAYAFLISITLVGLALCCFVTYAGNLRPFDLTLPFMAKIRKEPYFLDHYVKIHMRLVSYMIGIIAGAFIHDHKNCTWRLSKTLSRVVFTVVSVFAFGLYQFLGSEYYDPNYNYKLHTLKNVLMIACNKVTCAAGICVIIVLITVGDGLGWCRKILTPTWVMPFSRLSYGVLLSHSINQMYDVGVTRAPHTFSIRRIVFEVILDMFVSFTVSFIFAILLEQPLRRFSKLIINRSTETDSTKRHIPTTNGVKKTQ